MCNRIVILLLGVTLSVMAGCGFHLRGINGEVSHHFPALILDSNDPYSPLMRAIRHELRLNKITLVDDTREDIPSLRIVHATENRSTVSVFRDGKTAENQLKLIVEAQVLIPGQDIHSLNVSVLRSFFENPLNALAKNAESEVLSQEMREQAAQQLVRKLLKIRVTGNEKYHHSVSSVPAIK